MRSELEPGVVRVALPGLRWPLDPALAEGRDETTLARALYATPLRADAETGRLRPGLCTNWRAANGFRAWRLECRSAHAIAAQLLRVGRSRRSPARWLFAGADVRAEGGRTLRVTLPQPWRRFPYALTAVAAAPPSVPGPFRVVAASPHRVVLRRPGLRLIFVRLAPADAVRAFRAGEVDEAPVPAGDLGAVRTDPSLRGALQTRALLAVDVVGFDLVDGPLARRPGVRRVYWRTAPRTDYQALVAERAAATAFGLLPADGARSSVAPEAVRRARATIHGLRRVLVRVAVPPDPDRRYAAELVTAHWRELGLAAGVRTEPRFGERLAAGRLGAWHRRLSALYPLDEALPAALLLPRDGSSPWGERSSAAREELLRALAAADQRTSLERADAAVQAAAAVVPLAWAMDARLVSPRLDGWRQDVLGVVDYA